MPTLSTHTAHVLLQSLPSNPMHDDDDALTPPAPGVPDVTVTDTVDTEVHHGHTIVGVIGGPAHMHHFVTVPVVETTHDEASDEEWARWMDDRAQRSSSASQSAGSSDDDDGQDDESESDGSIQRATVADEKIKGGQGTGVVMGGDSGEEGIQKPPALRSTSSMPPPRSSSIAVPGRRASAADTGSLPKSALRISGRGEQAGSVSSGSACRPPRVTLHVDGDVFGEGQGDYAAKKGVCVCVFALDVSETGIWKDVCWCGCE